ncbi:MAG: EAL domain-containing protein, partial [Lachnospiraceae bacterium]|nr:EAL domain-containing protein [Lachnospiraceae bacterium]
IPALEEYRLIGKLDKAVIEIVCRDLQESITENRRVVPVSVNISRLDFELLNVPELFRSCLETFEIQPRFLHAEITESALVLSEGVLKKATEQLKELGSQLWLDDFGSGYSSLNVLKDYDFDVMKIDMSFLKNFEGNEKSRTILKSITAMASLIGMRTVCEGVETAEAADFLTQIGCERLQGYYFGKPMPLSEIWEKGEHFA